MKTTKQLKIDTASGFTLIEVLVSLAVIGILATLASVILINTLRSSNKADITNEAKENIALVAEYLERDVRLASSVSVDTITDRLTITNSDSSITIWDCESGSPGNDFISRQAPGVVALPLTNKDSKEGVNVSRCEFRSSASERVINLDLTLNEGKGISNGPQEFGVSVSETITAFTRGY